MKQLRRVIRMILMEENKKGLDSDKLWQQLEDFVPKQLEKLGAEISHFETDMMNKIKFAGEWYYNGVDKETLESKKSVFEDFLNKRGWNILKYSVETPFEPKMGRLVIQCDMQPNPKGKNAAWSMRSLADEEMVLLHVTPSKNVNSIKSKGFKPSRVSSDGVTFGGQRNFFFIMEYNSWESDKEEVMQWFSTTFAGKGREGYVGTSEEELSIIAVIASEAQQFGNRDKGVKANFYVDTEFGYGTGGINTRGMSFGDIWAVYTPTHFIPPNWSEVHEIW